MKKINDKLNFCSTLECKHAVFNSDAHGACFTFTKLYCGKYKREVDKGAKCLEYGVKK